MIINKTWDAVELVDADKRTICTFQACIQEHVAIIEIDMNSIKSIAEKPDSIAFSGKLKNLPEYQQGIYYVVSKTVKNALPDRTDLLVTTNSGKIFGIAQVS